MQPACRARREFVIVEQAHARQRLASVLCLIVHGLFDQARQHQPIGFVQRAASGGKLLRYRFAILIAFDHGLDAAHLPFNPREPFQHGLPLVL